MGKKKLQGADGMNFQLQLTIKGLESINLPEENLTNESGNDIMKISCWGGKLSAYVNEFTDYDSQWNTITVDFGDVGKVVCDKDSIKENEAGGRYFPSEIFTLK